MESPGTQDARGAQDARSDRIVPDEPVSARIDAVYRAESRRALATLIRLLGDFDRAEEALHEGFRQAVERWPREGFPAQPRAWIVSVGRFKAIDALRRQARFDAQAEALAAHLETQVDAEDKASDGAAGLEDDRLRLIFTCCHPALSPEARLALTLREVCGLTTEAIARAFLVETPTVAQRIVRAKAKIREARIPYEVPGPGQLPDRLEAVLRVLYLVYNEGYSASSGEALSRPDLSEESIRLARLLHDLLPEPEVQGLLALMLLQESRRGARADSSGNLVLLEDQDRSRWDRERIREGSALAETALRSRRFGPYTLQAAIAAVHAEATDAAHTDWPQIVGLYDVLLRADPSPVVALNRAVAVAMRDGPDAGLRLIDALLQGPELRDYAPAHTAKAELLRRAGHREAAAHAYREALARLTQETERRHVARRLAELEAKPP